MRRGRLALGVAAILGLCLAGSAPWAEPVDRSGGSLQPSRLGGPDRHYQPDRRDYEAFRAAHPDLLEPNYLPFMLHRKPGGRVAGDELILCRWEASRMPLAVHVPLPAIPAALQNEFDPRAPETYRRAAHDALGLWQDELEGEVRFRVVQDPLQADLRIVLRGERAPIPAALPGPLGDALEQEVLGQAEALREACRRGPLDPDADRYFVDFAVPEIEIFLADRHGLLLQGQVEMVVAHELGHALGMRGHSPHAKDLMYPVISNRKLAKALSDRDVRSFLALYRLPNGARYARLAPGASPERAPGEPPSGPPELAAAPHVDPRLGFSWQPPAGFRRSETDHGVFAANGPTWAFDASIEIAVWPSPSLEDFHARILQPLLAGRWLRSRSYREFFGRRGLEIVVEDAAGEVVESFRVIETGDARTLLFRARTPRVTAAAWAPWIERSFASLEFWQEPAAAGRGR